MSRTYQIARTITQIIFQYTYKNFCYVINIHIITQVKTSRDSNLPELPPLAACSNEIITIQRGKRGTLHQDQRLRIMRDEVNKSCGWWEFTRLATPVSVALKRD